MTNYTPNFGFPYPTGGDDPCDFAEQWCAFTDAVNTIFDQFQATIDRTVPTIPAAQMFAGTSRDYDSSVTNFTEFFSVPFDTAGWTDFDADQRGIVTDRAGVFNFLASHISDPEALNSYWTIMFVEQDSTGTVVTGLDQTVLDRGPGGTRIGNEVTDLISRNQPVKTYVEILVSSTNNFDVVSGYFTGWWHADTVRPA